MSENRIKEKEQNITTDQALAVLREQRERSRQACFQEIDAVLKKHGCRLMAIPGIVNGSIVAEVRIVDAQSTTPAL